MNDDPTVIYTAANVQQANLLKNWLADRGIDARVSGEALQGAAGELPLGWSSSPTVIVAGVDAQRARQLALEFERNSGGDAADEAGFPQELDEEDADAQWQDWPCCQQCGERRQAVCPSCENAGDDIPLAEFIAPAAVHHPISATDQPPAQQTDVLLMCPQCDEAFAPRFYRLCQWCGHDHGLGVTIEAESQRSEPHNPRMLAVIVVMGLLGVGILVYFWFVLRR